MENFRENIKKGFMPLPTDVSFGGVVKDYFFDTSNTITNAQPCTDLFCPVYNVGISPDPLLVQAFSENANRDLYVGVGLDSGLKESDVVRPPLNLVLIMDISGSMDAPFDTYYYDSLGNQKNLTAEQTNMLKLDVAKDVLNGVLGELKPEDKVSIVSFSDFACTALPLTPVSQLNIPALQNNIKDDVVTVGGTNIEDGLQNGSSILQNCPECLSPGLSGVENRLMLITDAQPNTGDVSTGGFLDILQTAADKNIFTTVIGVGLDFNTELIENITKVKGSLYFSVHEPGEFKRRLVDDFDYAVNPLVFDLELSVDPNSLVPTNNGTSDSSSWQILQIYGTPNPNDTAYAALGQAGNTTISSITTLFPSPKTEEGIKGGVVLLRMGYTNSTLQGEAPPLTLDVSYTDRNGTRFTSNRDVDVPSRSPGNDQIFSSSGTRKAVLLARYTDIVRNWLIDEWRRIGGYANKTVVIPGALCGVFPDEYCKSVDAATTYDVQSAGNGCIIDNFLVPDACILPTPVLLQVQLGQWERQSEKLRISNESRVALNEFLPYFKAEVAALNDPELQQEIDILELILAAPESVGQAAPGNEPSAE